MTGKGEPWHTKEEDSYQKSISHSHQSINLALMNLVSLTPPF